MGNTPDYVKLFFHDHGDLTTILSNKANLWYILELTRENSRNSEVVEEAERLEAVGVVETVEA